MNKEKINQPLVSIISVNYGQTELTIQMIQSIESITYSNIEIIVVDNGSPESCKKEINQKFPNVQVIESPHNLGFAGGNNLGVQKSKGKYILFINNDTEVEPSFLEPLVTLMENKPMIGMVSPKLKYFFSPNKNTIQWAGGESGISKVTIRGAFRGDLEEDMGQYDEVIPTELIHGAAVLVPMRVILEVGLMPDIYFLYYEELDWSETIKEAGYKLYYHGLSTVYHKESMSVGKNSPLKTYYMTRGRLIFTRRKRKGFNFLMGLLFFVFFSIPKNTLNLLRNREWRNLKAFFRGVFWHLKLNPVNLNPMLIKKNNGGYQILEATYQTVKKF